MGGGRSSKKIFSGKNFLALRCAEFVKKYKIGCGCALLCSLVYRSAVKLESLQIGHSRFRKFTGQYTESIKIVCPISPVLLEYKSFYDYIIISTGSYGSLARFKSLSRLMKVNENTVIGASGDIADFQYIQETLKQKM